MTARQGKQVASLLNQVSDFISVFAENVKLAVEQHKALAAAIDTHPAVARGRKFSQIVMDDAMDVFASMAAFLELRIEDFDRDSVRPEVYHLLLQKRDGLGVKKEDAYKKLEQHIAAKKTEIKTTGGMKIMPDFLTIALKADDPQLVEMMTEDWQVMVSQIATSFASPEAVLSSGLRQNLLVNLVQNINQKLEGRLNQTHSPGGATGTKPGMSSGRGKIDPELQTLLEAFGENLTARAAGGALPEVIGRDREVDQALAALINKNSPYALNHGPAGAGVTSVTHALAKRIAEGNVPAALKGAQVIRLKVREMKANDGHSQKKDPVTGQPMQYNMFINRLHTVLDKVAAHNAKGGPQIILNLTELKDLSERLPVFQGKDVLATAMEEKNSLRILGEISDEEKYEMEAAVPEFLDLFQDVKIAPPDDALTLQILEKAAGRLQKETGLAISKEVLSFTSQKAGRYLNDVAQPKGALAVLDAAAAIAQVRGAKSLDRGHVAEVVSARSGIPKEFIDSSLSQDIAALAAELPKRVMGQEGPLKEIASSLEDANDGINDPNKPLGVFFMPGNTGVGKTFTAETLAKLLHMPLITVDMGNYQDKHAKSKLIGAPPGYVGYNDTPELQKLQPFSVLLLDEFEKAHPEVQNIFLSAFDKGRLQLLNNGKEIDLRNCVIFMTSNLGTREAAAAKNTSEMGFSTSNEAPDANRMSRAAMEAKVKEALSPEFLNRVTVLYFNDLTEEVVKRIALREVEKVSDFLRDKNRNLTLSLSEQALDDLMALGFDPKMGARPMEKAALKHLKRPANAWFKEEGGDIATPTEIHVTSLKDEFNYVLRAAGSNDNEPPEAPRQKRANDGPAGPSL